MNPGHPSHDDIIGDQWHQSLEPEAGCLDLPVAELPRLNDLVGPAYPRADDADRILQRDPRDRGIQQKPHKIKSFSLFPTGNLGREPPRPAHRQMGAGRVGDHQIPVIDRKGIPDITLKMPGRPVFSRKKIAAPGFVAPLAERPADDPRKLAGNENSHRTAPEPDICVNAQMSETQLSKTRTRFGQSPH